MSSCHLPSATDNWTFDRGCSLHRRHCDQCSSRCALQNKAPVPKGYVLKRAFRNHNMELWEQYCLRKAEIGQACAKLSSAEFSFVPALSNFDFEDRLSAGCNEWRLLHGTSFASACEICRSNFSPSLVGTGATWRSGPGLQRGVPLYGSGLY